MAVTLDNAEREPARPIAVAVDRPEDDGLPLVLDSPHSGTIYPDDFRYSTTLEVLRGAEDRFVDDLFAGGTSRGATMVRALFARSYVDPNRSPLDIDLGLLADDWPEAIEPGHHSEMGVGLVFRLIAQDRPIYDRRLEIDEVRRRIADYWRPYHDTLTAEIDRLRALHGEVWHLDCHSMQPVGNDLSPDPGAVRPDFVLGDLDGRSASTEFTDFAASALRDLGYSVALNDPYRGAYIVGRYGAPGKGRHSLQIEVNRGLYLEPETLERKDGFAPLRDDMTRFVGRLAEFVVDRTGANATAQKKSKARGLAN